ncbi:peptide transporter [bacterium]|nr:MAG: peptide transporter [bacterium]
MADLGEEAVAPTQEETDRLEPQKFEDGFTLKTFLGALFIALFMLPGGMYLGLVAGQGIGDAAEWVTIVLFAEVARRSYAPLRKQEIYILFYIAASLTAVASAERGLAGGPFSNLIWNAYFAGSQASEPIRDQIPTWATPPANSPGIVNRELWHHDWWAPIGLLIVNELCGRLSWMGMGYALFRVTSDVERLPFPYAPVAASGATALSEAGSESWRWNVFSTGSILGLFFGALYIGIPVLTGVLFGRSFELFPIPFADYTQSVENIMPAAIVGFSFSLANVLMGFVLPFEIVFGAAVASVLGMIVANPILHSMGFLPNYKKGSGAILTKLSVDMDFWLSIGIGINIAIAILGIGLVLKTLRENRRMRSERRYSLAPPAGRGDVPIWIAIGAWLVATSVQLIMVRLLVPNFPIWIALFFGLLWSPFNSYISARMIGITGRGISFPYLKEASIVASGYQRVDVWYAPVPLADHGAVAQRFREVELTGTKLSSILKAEVAMFPLILGASFLFWGFFWNSNSLPNAAFPYAQAFWPMQAQSAAVIQQINIPRADGTQNYFISAIKPSLIGAGAAFGLVSYFVMNAFKWPLLFYYGFMGGIGLYPANTIPQLIGAWFGKRFMARKYGAENWARYAPVLLAGFSCGTGLIALVCISIALIGKAVAKLPY